MALKEEILKIVKDKGPVIPNDIKKIIGGDTFLISAILSELSTDKLIKISHTKIGGTPAYYTSGQEYKLLELKKHLNEKDQRTFDLLRQKIVLRDKDQDLLTRVGLRQIKDFAKPLEVNVKGEKEVFWKWYLSQKDEVERRIRGFFSSEKDIKHEEKERPKQVPEESEKQEEKTVVKETQKTNEINDFFYKKLTRYFDEKNIVILETNIIRKNSDIELLLQIPTSLGKVEYFCKAKNKKKCGDGDLSSAYIQGQMKKSPILFITTGEVTTKAMEKLEKDFKGLIVKQI
ncbi:MAG: hypothetical protein ABIC91_07035 [Nanoarchaeota archaeon]|nr:hypothetical protein [Nanoarchaeota archaeon]MBU1030005.1 hypothetical protein [Nanoarchaeota archaeon]MBU1850191.1 hypothetical protein [Nanoarchaeota archaeon]